jgi:hypothetical protein
MIDKVLSGELLKRLKKSSEASINSLTEVISPQWGIRGQNDAKAFH